MSSTGTGLSHHTDPAPAEGADGYSTRRATPRDIEAIAQLRIAMAREIVPAEAPDPGEYLHATRRYLHRAMPAGEYRGWIAESGDRIIATVGFFIFERPPLSRSGATREGRVVTVYTLPDWRGRGIATRMLTELVADARAQGLGRLRLAAVPTARPLYERLGFRALDREMELHAD
jgi:GNAT superfamily N-acetyltransferase